MSEDGSRGEVRMAERRPRVVVVGGGFGGLNAARDLRRAPVDVLVIDRRNYHLFQPLLYQVATAALSPAEIASPIRAILRRQKNAGVRLGEVVEISPSSKQVRLLDGTNVPYDYLVVATGAVDQYFDHAEWPRFAPGLKNVDEALVIRRRFLLSFEAAEQQADPDVRRALLTTVVIGAGPTGVEMAGAMAEMARHSLIRDFRRIDPASARIVLVEGGDRILPTYAPTLSARAEASLRKRGVEVLTNSIVTEITPDAVHIGEERLPTRTVVWAAGVGASPLGRSLGVELDRVGRVSVLPDLSVPGYPDIFVIGDLARFETASGEVLAGIAPVAMQQGRHAASNIARRVQGASTEPFHYRDKGTMATIGRGAAVAQIGPLRLSGFIAWLAWIFIHIFYLIGFRNRLGVMMEWAWEYLTWQRGARLITGPIADLSSSPAPPAQPPSSTESHATGISEAAHPDPDH
jgi:NADH dehydrogenase